MTDVVPDSTWNELHFVYHALSSRFPGQVTVEGPLAMALVADTVDGIFPPISVKTLNKYVGRKSDDETLSSQLNEMVDHRILDFDNVHLAFLNLNKDWYEVKHLLEWCGYHSTNIHDILDITREMSLVKSVYVHISENDLYGPIDHDNDKANEKPFVVVDVMNGAAIQYHADTNFLFRLKEELQSTDVTRTRFLSLEYDVVDSMLTDEPLAEWKVHFPNRAPPITYDHLNRLLRAYLPENCVYDLFKQNGTLVENSQAVVSGEKLFLIPKTLLHLTIRPQVYPQAVEIIDRMRVSSKESQLMQLTSAGVHALDQKYAFFVLNEWNT